MTVLVFGRSPSPMATGVKLPAVGWGLDCHVQERLASMILSKEITVSCLTQEVESNDPLSPVRWYVLPPDDLNQIYVAK